MSEKKEHLKWNSKFIFQFFNIYKLYECLWDVNCEDYNRRDVREASFNRLVEHLQEEGLGVINRDQLKGKIKSLKDSFRIELNKVKKSMKNGASADDIYTPKLVWFNVADYFWRTTVLGRDSSSNQDVSKTNISAEDEDAVESRSSNSGSYDEPANNKQSASKALDSPTLRVRKRTQTKMDAPPRPPKSSRLIPPTRQEGSDIPRQIIPKVTKTDGDDQFDQFAKHVASQLREMPVRSFIILQSQIQELISTERLRIIDSEEEAVFAGSDIHSSTQELEEDECRVF